MFFGRGANKIQDPLTLRNIYEDFEKEVKVDNPYYVDRLTFYSIFGDYITAVIDKIILKGMLFKFPFGLGTMQIIKQKVNIYNKKTTPIDWKTSVALGKAVPHFNDHSGGYKYSFRWSKLNAIILNKNFYAFRATRTLKRELARKIKAKEQDYFLYQKNLR
jgi:hypothetical protein